MMNKVTRVDGRNKCWFNTCALELLKFLGDIIQDIFVMSLIAYLVLMLLETIRRGTVSFFFDANIFQPIILATGIIAALSAALQKEKVQPNAITLRELGFIIALGVMGVIVVWQKSATLGILAYFLAALSGFLIVLLSMMVIKQGELVRTKQIEYLLELLVNNGRYVIASLVLIIVVLSAFFGNITILGLTVRLRYLIILYFVLCLVFELDSKFLMATAFLLLLCSALLVLSGNVVEAVRAATIALVSSGIGFILYLAQYAKNKWLKHRH